MESLNNLENESLSIIGDTLKNAENPLILYSIGKDSSVLLHLFRKYFYPLNVPIKLLHIDTGWKFSSMIEFRDNIAKKYQLNLDVYKKENKEEITPFNSDKYTDIQKTQALKEALKLENYDIVYGGARRDEEVSRSKERVVSHRNKFNAWDPKKQRIEPWLIFNLEKSKEESFRVFPLSNWTELNIWEYIKKENIEIVPLYFAKKRKVVLRNEQYFLLDDNRFELVESDTVLEKVVRFRTLGCYPLTAGIESNANNVDQIIDELKKEKNSERAGRLIDKDKTGSMELKKREGYF